MGIDNAIIEFLPLDFTSIDEVMDAFDRIEYTGGVTSSYSALMLVRSELMPLIRAVLGRKGQKSIIFILTNRRVTMDENREYEAEILKQAGAEIYCVGITEKVHKETLHKIASDSKDEPHVFIFPNSLSLSKLIQVIMKTDYSQCGLEHVAALVGSARGATTDGPGPWMAAIYISPHNTVDTADAKLQCGGSIIHESFVLTAAVCMYTKDLVIRNLEEVIIKVGLTNMKDESFVQEHEVQNLFIHPKYSVRGSFDYDIVLLQLRKPIEFNERVRPICLPPPGLPEDTTFYKANELGLTTRWSDEGLVPQNMNVQRKSTEKIERLILPIQSRESCIQSLVDLKATLATFTDRMFCAGNGLEGNDICHGERGRPMMQSQLNSKGYLYWTQVGIFSWGIGCGIPNTYGYYSHVQQLRIWIDNTIEDAIKETA